jgi:hypothetical protein
VAFNCPESSAMPYVMLAGGLQVIVGVAATTVIATFADAAE